MKATQPSGTPATNQSRMAEVDDASFTSTVFRRVVVVTMCAAVEVAVSSDAAGIDSGAVVVDGVLWVLSVDARGTTGAGSAAETASGVTVAVLVAGVDAEFADVAVDVVSIVVVEAVDVVKVVVVMVGGGRKAYGKMAAATSITHAPIVFPTFDHND